MRLIVSIVVSLTAFGAGAQRPDGSQRPVNPPLRDNTWLVVPFTNTTRDASVAWLGDASVRLLSTDMSRWTEIRVIDAERVTDLMSNLLEAGREQISLQTAVEMAQKVGAGRIVMGDFLKTGARTTITARVFNTRTSERVRIVSDTAVNADAIPVTYQRLAPRVLNVPLPAGVTLAGVGTNSIEALRAYTLGMQFLDTWRQDSADFYFARAVHLDSTFALAEVQVRSRWSSAPLHALNLPERDRMVIAIQRGGLPAGERCQLADRLIARDSSDAEAWYARGSCQLFNGPQAGTNTLVAGADGQPRIPFSVNERRVALARAVELQPSISMTALTNMLLAPYVVGCTSSASPCPIGDNYFSAVGLEADTIALRFIPNRAGENPARLRVASAARRARLTWARDFAARIVASYPRGFNGHYLYGMAALRLGDIVAARRELNTAAIVPGARAPFNLNITFAYRAEAEWKAGRPEVAVALVDTMGMNAAVNAYYEAAFGIFERQAARFPTQREFILNQYKIRTGAISRDFSPRQIGTGWSRFAFRYTGRRPAADTAFNSPLDRFQSFLVLGDTARARVELSKYDAWGSERADDWWDAYEMFAAESYLQLGDTVTAWKRIEPFAERFRYYDLRFAEDLIACVGRAWMLYADLAIATGHKAEAKRGYTMITGMWAKADPSLQPTVTRAKEALTKLGGT